jgi:hypothetical protein
MGKQVGYYDVSIEQVLLLWIGKARINVGAN